MSPDVSACHLPSPPFHHPQYTGTPWRLLEAILWLAGKHLGSIWEPSGSSLEAVLGLAGKHLGNIWEASGSSLEAGMLGNIWEASGSSLEAVLGLAGKHLGAAGKLLEAVLGLAGIWEASGRSQNQSVMRKCDFNT